MSLLQKITARKTEDKTDNYFDFYLKAQITNLKNQIYDLSLLRRKDQKNLRIEKAEFILKELSDIEKLYISFNRDLLKFKILQNKKIEQSEDLEERIFLMTEKKQSLRKEFEKIYINFKHMATGFDDIPTKTILSKMRKTFDFDNKIKNLINSNT